MRWKFPCTKRTVRARPIVKRAESAVRALTGAARTALGALILWALAIAGASGALAQDFTACVRALRSEAAAKGITARTFDTAMTGVEPDQGVLEAMDNQPEFKVPIWDYMAVLVDEQRIADGRAKLGEWATVLAEAERKFGVDRHVIVAVWGIESDYGKVRGGRPLVRSLATVSCFGGRQRFFRGELIATLNGFRSG